MVLGHDRRHEPVQLAGAGEVGAERLLEDQAGARGHADPGEGLADPPRHRRRQREVDDERLHADREQCPQVVLRGRVGALIARFGDHPLGGGTARAGGGERLGDPLPPAVVVPVVGPGAEQEQTVGAAGRDQPPEAGKKQPRGQIAAGAEDQQRLRRSGAVRLGVRFGAHSPLASAAESGVASWPS